MPEQFQSKGKHIIGFRGTSIAALNEQLTKLHDRHTPYESWNSVTFALATMAKQAGLPNEQIAALLRCDLSCNQHVMKFESDRDQQRAITRAIMRSRDPELILSRASPLHSAEQFAAKAERRIVFHHEEFYEWQGTRYDVLTSSEMDHRVYLFLKCAKVDYWDRTAKRFKTGPFNPKSADVSELIRALKGLVSVKGGLTPPTWLDGRNNDGRIIACANGLVRLSDKVLLSHTPDYFNTSALDFNYDPQAEKPAAFLKFIGEVFATSDKDKPDQQSIDALQEMFGYIVSGDRSLHKIFLLVGELRAGKGTISHLLRGLVGEQGYASSSLTSFSYQFGLQTLINKLLIVMPDEDATTNFKQTGSITKHLKEISGGDTVEVHRKGIAAWNGVLPGCIVIMMNGIPQLKDKTGVLATRFIVLPFNNSFYGKEDTSLKAKLMLELPGILNWAIKGWNRLEKRGRFIQPELGRADVDLLQATTSEIRTFVEQRCVRRAGATVGKNQLFQAYTRWLVEQDRPDDNLDQRVFGRELKNVVRGLTDKHAGKDGTRYWKYVGIALKEAA